MNWKKKSKKMGMMRMREVHAEGMRERRNMREAAKASQGKETVFRCRRMQCGATHPERLETCPECGFEDPNSVHGASMAIQRTIEGP